MDARILNVLRIVVGLMFMEHGTSKLFHYQAAMGHVPLFSLLGLAGGGTWSLDRPVSRGSWAVCATR